MRGWPIFWDYSNTSEDIMINEEAINTISNDITEYCDINVNMLEPELKIIKPSIQEKSN